MMDIIMNHPFLQGLLVGLGLGGALAIVTWFNGLAKRRGATKELSQLRDHLHNQMQITAKGTQESVREIEQLKKQNENLRITVATLKSKPGRGELQTLQLYDKAIHLMYEKAPGFAPSWEAIMKEVEAEMKQTDTGLTALLRKIVRPSLTTASPQPEPAENNTAKPDLLKTSENKE
jgi:hypothetical protein